MRALSAPLFSSCATRCSICMPSPNHCGTSKDLLTPAIHDFLALLLQVVDLLQNSMPLRYDDLSASQAFLKATMAVNDLTTDLHKHHGAVRDFMRELLSSVCCCHAPPFCLQSSFCRRHPHNSVLCAPLHDAFMPGRAFFTFVNMCQDGFLQLILRYNFGFGSQLLGRSVIMSGMPPLKDWR